MIAVIVETTQLLETIAASLVAGIGLTTVFSIAIWAGARFVDLSVAERRGAAAAAATLGIVALMATLGAVVFGLVVMMSK
jgi:hypothetical protein